MNFFKLRNILSMLFIIIACKSIFANNEILAISPKSVSADVAILSVKSYGFVDLEGAKTSAIIVQYNTAIDSSSVNTTDYEITDYTTFQESLYGFDKTIELDGDNIKGNEGKVVKIYVNNEPNPSSTGGVTSGNYVIIEVNTSYMLSGQNLSYTSSMMAGIKQIGDVSSKNVIISSSTKEINNYTKTQKLNQWNNKMDTIITTDKEKIILPEFEVGSGWIINHLGSGAFKATNCYSEYTGKYENFELPYSIYIPDKKTLEKNKGNISLVIHMEHAGSNDTDPMAALTSSKASAKLSSSNIQEQNPAIIIVPQIEETRRSTNDVVASSEANTAVWELIDYILNKYKGYINTDRIYGTGQSMGGMTILNMAAQRDNFFAGIAVVGAQWSNSYNKPFQNNNSLARSPKNDSISFNGFGLDLENYQNWYYMVSDDNILIHTCSGDPMATGEWTDLAEYYKNAGVSIPYEEWDPYLDLTQQNEKDSNLVNHDNSSPGSGINWGSFTRGSHMSTWKYGYQLDSPFQWLFAQNRMTEIARGKIEQLKNKWLGRNVDGDIVNGSGTTDLNSAQYTPGGASKIYTEGWTPVSATIKLINQLPLAQDVSLTNKKNIEIARTAYEFLVESQKKQVTNYNKLVEDEKVLLSLL